LIGTSLGLAARAAGYRVSGWDVVPQHAQAALERGGLDDLAGSPAALLADAEVLAIAVPLEATVALLRVLAADPPRARLVIDVASLKVPVRAAAAGLPVFVGTHPLAGSERSGPAAADAALFTGRTWTYEADAAEPARSAAVALIAATGARPWPIAAADHDRAVALTSHLPQVVATALAGLLGRSLDRGEIAALCGPGMASMTRLGGSSWAMWGGILSQNAPAVAQEVRALTHILSEAAEALETGRAESLEPWFVAAAAAVARLSK
jgi:prephenate dehydrogenase